jgi:hypothetical protein
VFLRALLFARIIDRDVEYGVVAARRMALSAGLLHGLWFGTHGAAGPCEQNNHQHNDCQPHQIVDYVRVATSVLVRVG